MMNWWCFKTFYKPLFFLCEVGCVYLVVNKVKTLGGLYKESIAPYALCYFGLFATNSIDAHMSGLAREA